MGFFMLLLIMISAAIIETTVFTYFSLWHSTPNIMLLLVIICGLWGGRQWGVISGIIAGVVSDLLSGSLGGVAILSMPLIGFLSGIMGERTFRESFLIFILCTSVGTLVVGSMDLVSLNILGVKIPMIYGYTNVIFPQLANNILASLILYRILYYAFMYIDGLQKGPSFE